MFLLCRVSALVASKSNSVNLVEGFVSFKTHRSGHTEDALALLASIDNPSIETFDVKPTALGERPVNLRSLIGLVPPEEPCPTVVVVTV